MVTRCSEEAQLEIGILVVTIDILDRVFPVDKAEILQLYGIVCLWISSKIIGTDDALSIIDLIGWSSNSVTKEQLVETECEIVSKLEFKLYRATLYSLNLDKVEEVYQYLLNNVTPLNIADVHVIAE